MSDEARDVVLERYEDMIADEPGAFVSHGLRVVSYINPEGERMFKWQFEGKQSRSESIGDLQRICAYLMAADDDWDGGSDD